MAGSNGSPAQRRGQPQHWSAESDEQSRALEMERWRQQQAQHGYQQHGYPQQPPLDQDYGGQYAQTAYQQGGHGDPYAAPVRNPMNQPYQEPAPQQHGQQSPFAPHFERFAPVPAAHEAQPAYDPHALPGGMHEPVLDPFHAHRNQPQQYDSHQGYSGQQGQAPHQYQPHDQYAAPGDGRTDPQSWDLSQYQPGQIPQGYQNGQYPGHDPHAPQDWATPDHAAHDPHWPQQGQGGQPGWTDAGMPGQHHGGYDPATQGQYPNQFEPPFDQNGHPHAAAEGEDYDQPEQSRRGSRTVMVAGLLIGAIVAGAGLAVAYKQFGGVRHSAKVAEIKRQAAPEKVRPDEPGGKTMDHSGNKFLNRLAADGSGSESRQSDVDGSSKRVATIPIVVNRDGSYTPQASTETVSAPPSTPSSGVPGLVLDGFGPPPVPASQPPPRLRTADAGPQQASRLPPPPPEVTSPPPRVAELPLPKVRPSPPEQTAAVVHPEPSRRTTSRQRDDYVATSTSTHPPRKPAPSVSHSGYVAVLASKRSRQDALNAFADLHSQYPEILSKVTPDVREANLGSRGVWYRLIGGPPGSRESARSLCVKLKARGMKDCWPVAY